MKKITILLTTIIFLESCSTTSTSQDTQMLQSKYSTVYKLDAWRYICIDSTNVYDVRVTSDGRIETTVKIK